MAANNKVKLTIDEQINDLEEKGVTFDGYSKDDAVKYLKFQNYYFKLKSFARNYHINERNGKYVNLDFSYLVELSSLDTYIRKYILEMSIDIEHFLKVRFLYDLSQNESEDGYNLISRYVAVDRNSFVQKSLDSEASSYTINYDLAKKYKDDLEHLSAWNAVEILSFGAFADLYHFYYHELYPIEGKKRDNYSPYLKSVQFLRNAAAHNNALLSSIRNPRAAEKFNPTNKLTSSISQVPGLKDYYSKYKSQLQNPIIHDFVALIFVFNDMLRFQATRKKRDRVIHELKEAFSDSGRICRHKEYFVKNQAIVLAYEFISKVLSSLDNNNHHKPSAKYLQNGG